MFSAFDTVSADSSIIYVNDSGGNDDWDGQYAEWIVDTLSGPKKSIKNGTGTVTEGGTVNIADGTYTGENNTNIIINKNMNIKGQSKDGTIINGAKSAQIFQVQNGVKVTIANLTLANGNADHGGAILNYGNLTVKNGNFTGNNATYGGAILNLGNLTVIDSYFSANNATSGGAISNSVTLNIKNSKFEGNSAHYMGGAIENAGDLTVSDSDFTGNKASSGGAIYNYADSGISGDLNVKNCTFTGNQAIGTAIEAFGGTIFNLGTLIIDNSTFTSNSAIKGGTIYNKGSSILNNVTFVSNTASSGGAIYNEGNLTVINSTFNNNNGGAIWNYQGTLNISDSTFMNNNAIDYGGAIHNGRWNSGNMTITNCTFNNNTAISGGAIWNDGNGSIISNSKFNDNIASGGGAIYNYGSLTVLDCPFTGNNAFTGGAIYNSGIFTLTNGIFNNNKVFSYSAGDYLNGGAIYNNGTFTLTNGTFSNNRANNYGGAIYSNGTFDLTNSTFDGNSADTGGAIYNYGERIKGNYGIFISTNCTFNNNYAITGGAIYNIGTLTLTDSMFNNNDAIASGTIYNDYRGVLAVYNSTFNNNSGGAIFNNGGLDVLNSSFTGNSASYGGAIFNNGGLTINNCIFNKNKAKDGGSIWSASCSHLYLISNSTFTGNIATNYGGAIYAESNDWRVNPIISNSTFIDNTAYGGGAIYTEAVLTITNSTFNGNNVTNWGGAIYNINNLTATNNTFSYNKAFNGGSICNGGELTLNNSTLTNNNAAGYGGVIYNYFDDYFTHPCSSEVHFNRIVGNTATFLGSAIYNDDGAGLVNATLNWWGSNNDPSSNIYGANVTVTPWLVLNITSNPNTIFGGGNSTIIVDLQHDSNGIFHDPANGHIPDGIPITFTGSFGSLNTITTTLLNGQAQSLFTTNSLGTADISTAIDDQIVHAFVTVIPPAVAAIDPVNNTKTNSTNKVITVTFNEEIQTGSAYDSISVTGPSGPVSMTKSIKGNVLTITPTSSYINGNYTVNIPVNAVTDLVGNTLETAFTSSFTVDTVPPVVTATPTKDLSNSSITVNLSSESDATIYYRINSGTWNTFTGSGKVSISNIGTNKLEFYAVDAAGNPSAHTTYSYTIDKTAPVVTATPTSGLSNDTIGVTISSESNAKIYYRINSGSWHVFTGSGKVLISSAGTNKLEFYAVDAAGNPSAHKTYTYTIDKTAPKVTSTYPKNSATGVSRTAAISIKFNENIKASINWSKIYIKNLRTGKLVVISKSISGNTLKIKMSSKRYAYNWYQVYIPKSAVKDSAGNNLAAGYTLKFKTGRY